MTLKIKSLKIYWRYNIYRTGLIGMATHNIMGPMMSLAGPLAMAQRGGGGFGGYGGYNNQTVVDKAPPEIHHMIDPYWYQFPPMNPLWYGILGFVIGCLGIVSVIGNGMVVFIFSSTKSLRTPSNLLVINLAFSDFCMMLTMSPPMVINPKNLEIYFTGSLPIFDFETLSDQRYSPISALKRNF